MADLRSKFPVCKQKLNVSKPLLPFCYYYWVDTNSNHIGRLQYFGILKYQNCPFY